MKRIPITPTTAGIATGLYVVLWSAVSFIVDIELLDTAGWVGFYLIGLCWTIWSIDRGSRLLESKHAPVDDEARIRAMLGFEPVNLRKTWNPLDSSSKLYTSTALLIGFFACGLVAAAGWSVYVAVESQRDTTFAQTGTKPPDPWWLRHVVNGAIAGSSLALLWLAGAFSQSRKMRQSLGSLAAYSLLFALIYLIAHIRFDGSDGEFSDELPAGGGSDAPQAMSVKVQKVVRKKYVINPYSSILFAAPPPIDNVQVNLDAETANRYQVGQGDGGLGDGDGEGGGFGSGTGKGKINWYRLRHSDRGWDKNFGVGGDRNLLLELEIRYPRMKGKIAEENQSIDCAQLARFKETSPPYLVYIGGYGFAPTPQDKKILKQYIVERHGMILGDSLASGFGGGFQAAMTEITGVQPVTIPRDDPIHKRPFELPTFPFVVNHNGTAPLGWKVDGRWAVYWHPGALSDAWRDDRAGIRKEIAAQCYQLGLNIMAYAMKEQNTWRLSQKP